MIAASENESGGQEFSTNRQRSDHDEFLCLWQRVQANDEAAFSELVERFDSLLRVVIRDRLGAAARRLWDTDDRNQVVWSALYARRSSVHFESAQACMPYLVQIARNQVATVQRQQRVSIDPELDVALTRSFDPTPSEVFAHRETMERIRQVDQSAELMVTQRSAGWSFARIARYFGLNERTIQRRFSQLRAKLFGQ